MFISIIPSPRRRSISAKKRTTDNMSVDEPLATNDENASLTQETEEEESPKIKKQQQNQCLRTRITNFCLNIPTNVPRHLIWILLLYNVCFMLHQIFFAHPGAPKLDLRRVLFYSFFTFGMLIGSIFIYKRIVSIAHKNRTKPWYKKGKLALNVFAYVWILLAHSIMIYVNIPLPETFFFPVICYLLLGAWLHCFIFLLAFFIIEKISRCIPPLRKNQIFTSETLHTILAISLAFLLTLEGFISTSQAPTVKNLNIGIKNLPKEFNGFSIALVSDIHVGPTVNIKRVEKIVETINKMEPDITTIVGDLVDGYVEYIGKRAKPLKNLKSRYGNFVALGNHDYLHENVEQWINFFKNDLNLTVLLNSGVIFNKMDSQICLAGVEDYITESMRVAGHRLDPEKALKNCPKNGTTILLSHQPNGAAKVLKSLPKINKHVDLILSGHTHAGQMFVTAPITYFSNPFFYGLYYYSETDTQIYVSSGVNYWGPPIKMFPSLCEIVNIKLRRTSV
uniref:Calcineurin-like phosphoesterase domain-containing protein n=1 Tax=Panagrolaimus sp. PS1159 TaxID=55785 RepID=A0AC35F3D5_9BILA